MTEPAWNFDLFEPGMTGFHRAGLVGLLASLQSGCMGDTVHWQVSGNKLSLSGIGDSEEDVHRLLQTIYHMEEGLVSFPIFGPRLLAEVRADIQSILLQTFLQHGKSRELEPGLRVVGAEEDTPFQYKPLLDFKHRSLATAQVIVKSKKSGKFIPVAGWALPGAVTKHIAHLDTSWEDTPERFLLLMCAPLGCLYFKAQSYDGNGDWDKRTQSVIVIPEAVNLEQQVTRLVHFYEGRSQETRIGLVGGVSDAVLRAAMEVELEESIRGQGMQFYGMRFGDVPWSKQQKTRTGALTIRQVNKQVKEQYHSTIQWLGNQTRKSARGDTYQLVMPMRERIVENLLRREPWYLGFHKYMHGKRRRLMMTWREGMRELVENRGNWDNNLKKGFVDVVQKSVNNRFGKVYSQAISASSDTRRAFSREYERMILSFQNCRTKEAFRETLMRFIAGTYPRLKSDTPGQLTERDILQRSIFEGEVDWKELRDLCLLAIATYRGTHASQLDSENTDVEELEDSELMTKEND